MPQRPSPARVSNVDAATALTRHRDGVPIIDVRDAREWRAGHIPDALNLPLNGLSPHDVPSGGPVLIICRSGSRSAQAAGNLAAAGIPALNVVGGMTAWAAIGGPMQAETGQPPTVA